MANRHALLIGVPVYDDDEFSDERLGAAVRSDVAAMEAALKQSHYVIDHCPSVGAESGDATLNRIKAAIDKACANAPVGGVLLIYFSGHGITIDGRDYLIPSDSYRPEVNQGSAESAAPWRLQSTVAEASAALRAVYPDVRLPSVPADCEDLVVPWAVHDALLNSDEISWQLRSAEIGLIAWATRRPLGDFLATLDPFRRLGAPVPAYNEEARDTLNRIVLDEYDADILIDLPEEDRADGQTAASAAESVTALRLVQVAGRYGWTLAEAHQRFARLVPIGLRLDYPQLDLPDEIVRWEDLLVLTTYFDGQPPVITGTIDQAYLEHAAEEIFDATPAEIPAKADWLRQRLTIYAPLFSLELQSRPEDIVD